MATLFSVKDPTGIEIVLDQERWYEQIVAPLKCPYLLGQEAAVEKTLTSPDAVTQDARHPQRKCYYKADVLRPPFRRHYLRVVVGYNQGDAGLLGEVVTAQATDALREELDISRPAFVTPALADFDFSGSQLHYDAVLDEVRLFSGPPTPGVNVDAYGAFWLRIDPKDHRLLAVEIEDFQTVFLRRRPELRELWKRCRGKLAKGDRPSVQTFKEALRSTLSALASR